MRLRTLLHENRPVSLCLALAALVLLALAWVPAAQAAEAKPKAAKATADTESKKPAGSALDDALLKDLDNELLEGAGDLQNGAKKKSAEPPAADARPGTPEGDKDHSGEDIGAPPADEDPLTRISQEMRSAEDFIREVSKRKSAEQMQRRVVEDLSSLIEQAEKQAAQQASSSKAKKSQKTGKRQLVQQPSRGQSGKDSNKPAKDSTDRLGKAEDARPDPKQLKEMMKDSWGHLPPHEREQMSQNWPERFLPQYELMIERYYKRLAEEQGTR